ncbi:hypothetical protein MUK42_33569 [Musa troglodytarum]|uniref:RRM domain-containing protein n=1 Tax=Musa troglodytarum TaxID=320322 RepID=A0A9E7HQ37_9LILI|nr:hypothetical protein MUK42_33569 [Musa troglodytarum]
MEDSKKRKLEEEDGSGGAFAFEFSKQLRFLLDPSERISSSISLGNQYPSVAEEIKGLASEDPVHRKLLFVACLGRLLQKLCVLVHGEIEEGAVIVDKATGKSRGYGFITYKHMESTQKALQEPSKYGEIKKVQLPMIKRLTNQGFGFVTYRTVEAAKKAIDDPNKTLGLADSPKSKIIQSQVPAAMVPITIPVPVGYAQTGKTQIGSSATVGYASYPPAMAAYPAAYPNAQIQYPTAPQVSYPQTGKRESVGLPAVASPGITGFPYYVTKP